MRKIFFGTFAYLIFGFSLAANAYEVDTHFYATYAMARYVGIGHEIASQIALSAQWMDETNLSSPFLLLPVSGDHARRLFHFCGTRKDGKFPGLNRVFDKVGVTAIVKTERN